MHDAAVIADAAAAEASLDPIRARLLASEVRFASARDRAAFAAELPTP